MRLSDYSAASSTAAAAAPPRDAWKVSELAAWVPLRLSPAERHLLAVLEQTLNVSEYTDHVDVSSRRSGGLKTRRILDGVLEVCHIATGLASASGQERQLTTSLSLSPHGNHSHNNHDPDMNDNDDMMGGVLGVGDGKGGKKDRKSKNKKGKKQKLTKRLKKKAAVAAEEARRLFSINNSKISSAATNGVSDGAGATDDPNDTNADNTNHHPHVPWASRDPEENAALFQTMCEIGRRNKVLNPNSMRTTYGKLMYMLQDAQNPTVAKSLGFSLHKDLVLVKPYLEQHGLVDLLYDSRLECAVQYIHDRDLETGKRLERQHVEALVQGKRRVTQELVDFYGNDDSNSTTTTTAQDDNNGDHGNSNTNDDNDVHQSGDAEAASLSGMESDSNPNDKEASHKKSPTKKKANGGRTRRGPGLSRQDVCRVIESLADAVAYIESNVRPVQQMLQYLQDNFDPNHEEREFSLTLRGASRGYNSSSALSSPSLYSRYGLSAYGGNTGSSSEGPTLSHSHSTQYTFVWQSLTLWSKVMRHMHRLWVCADDDLLSTTSTYHLYNTGQGLNRVQQCPKVRRVMGQLLQQTQAETTNNNSWVGLSVIHLGDRDVPNALIFIDKYTQIPRFLNPIVHFLQNLPELCQNETILSYVKEQFGAEQRLQRTVLADYFKHGFDGSGDDGGSCMYVYSRIVMNVVFVSTRPRFWSHCRACFSFFLLNLHTRAVMDG
jgi:hypothetical protein